MAPKPTAVATTVRLIPSTSSFDFLEGAFAAAQRTRKVGIGITLFALITLTALAMTGVGGLLAKRSAEELLTQTDANNIVALQKLAQIDNAGGIGADQITSHVTERERALKAAVGGEIDVVSILGSLRSTAPDGVTVNSVKFTEAGAGATTTDPSSATPAAPAAPAAPATTDPSAGATIGTLEISGTVTSFALIGSWAQTVAGIPGMSGVNPTWSGGGTAISTTLSANITEAALTQRAQALKAGESN